MTPYYAPDSWVDLGVALGMFFASPAAILFGIALLLGAVNFAVRVIQAWQAGTFDLALLPQVLDTLIVRKVAPLIIIGSLMWMTFEWTRVIVGVTYIAWSLAVILAEGAQLARSLVPLGELIAQAYRRMRHLDAP